MIRIIKITGTLIKNYFHCKREAWLFYHQINFENELTKIGEVMHEEKQTQEIRFLNIVIDKIKNDYLIEFKKSKSNYLGAYYQTLFYLDALQKVGIKIKAKIKFIDENEEKLIIYNKKNEEKLKKIIKEIEKTVVGHLPQIEKNQKECKGCSFYEFCWC